MDHTWQRTHRFLCVLGGECADHSVCMLCVVSLLNCFLTRFCLQSRLCLPSSFECLDDPSGRQNSSTTRTRVGLTAGLGSSRQTGMQCQTCHGAWMDLVTNMKRCFRQLTHISQIFLNNEHAMNALALICCIAFQHIHWRMQTFMRHSQSQRTARLKQLGAWMLWLPFTEVAPQWP